MDSEVAKGKEIVVDDGGGSDSCHEEEEEEVQSSSDDEDGETSGSMEALHSYWSTIFLIPNGIMNKIDSICRNFLWGGKDSYLRAPAVSWDKCCAPKAEGGLGIKNSKNWKKALFGKYVWWIASKKDHLWVKWISHVYLKNCWMGKQSDYTIIEGYNWLRGPSPKVSWWKICWNTMNVPKASFIYWAAVLRRLLTKDRLNRMGGVSDLSCYLCHNNAESHENLFFYCPFSNRCVQVMQQKLNVSFNPRDLVNWNRRGRRNSILVRRITCAYYVQLVYHIWHERNKARLYSKVTHPVIILKQGIQAVCIRFRSRNTSAITRGDEAWLQHLMQ
ncbi:uncharacterized protein LOC141658211 [Silene latifolia]|uniref:uncharacterized protein LOC141658211 n=1 Tax=Silene latifolia TaxID=37657 RepID=UPI003D787429